MYSQIHYICKFMQKHIHKCILYIYVYVYIGVHMGFPGGANGKELACQSRKPWRHGFHN